MERSPDLPADRFVGLPRDAADGDDCRPRLLCERRPFDGRRDEDKRAGGRVDPLTVQLESRPATVDEVELLFRASYGV
jgi:hypothetical protein